ncbi:polysaccharide deacetylase family protein [Actinomadura macrotermitis]|uniref:NodB homology domain-containing protein n=1 Tax=Actinomadura macrotermitis TaxID=2585200 RepID=A0A7K0C5K1_9ACTN|nr:polysaccharide deacetylase family protein [Actinomadura macrotermitis]MQY08392.1 hypothetical protein [Actinomadura macrotermitis]
MQGAARRAAWVVIALVGCGWLSALPSRTADDRAPMTAGILARPVAQERPVPRVDCARARCVALTFDDGPAGGTAGLLAILAGRGVKATFFVVGRNVAERPDLVRQEAAAGHEVGDHGYTHADLGKASAAKIDQELTRTQEVIRQATGTTPVLMRPPYGSTGRALTEAVKRRGMAQIMWTVDPVDWKVRDTRAVERRILDQARPGSILLVHDIHPTSVAAVPAIIDGLRRKGYVFATVSELIGRPLVPGRRYDRRPSP